MSNIKSAVSLYSLQNEYLTKKMNLKEIIQYVKECGAQGVEIVPDQMLKNAPHISDESVAEFKEVIAETGLTPVIADVYLNTNLYKNRTLTQRECIDLLIDEIKMANKLGIPMLRLVSMVPYWVCEPLLPYCEKYGVVIALEVHAAMAFDIPETKAFIEEMKRLNSPYVGLVIDTGIFCRRFPRRVSAYESQNGTNPAIFEYMDMLFKKGTDFHAEQIRLQGAFPPELKDIDLTEHDKMFLPLCDGYENLPFEVMDDLLPYIKHFHFKLFEMTPEGPEYSMDYKALLEYLHDHDWSGFVATEYEGNRFTIPGTPFVEKEQVAANVKYVNECLKEIQGQEG